MAEAPIDKKLEGRLFDLLEDRVRIRLGDLVLLRRRSRERGVTLLHTALEAGRLTPAHARELAEEAGMPEATLEPDADESLSDSMLDSVVDAPPTPRGVRPSREPERSEPPSPPIPTLRAPAAVTERASRNTLREPSPPRPPQRSSGPLERVPPPPPPPPSGPPPSGPPPLRPPSSPPSWMADRPTVKMDEPPAAARVFDRISAPRRMPRRIDEASADERTGRPSTPRVVGELRPMRRTPPVPEAAPPQPSPPPMARPVSPAPPPIPDVVQAPVGRDTVPAFETADDELLEEDFEDEWGDTAPPSGAEPGEGDESPIELPAGAARYALGEELGRGGMGQILEARDIALDRPVALKLLHDADQADPALRMRFVDEARVTGQLQHPSVPPVYDLGRLGDGRLFFAMKRIEGRTLRDVIEELAEGQPSTVRDFGRVRLLMVFGRVCRAIAYAHSRGVMHRDLKPDNIMLGEFGEVTVMDWGLAKPFDAPEKPTSESIPIATTREGSGRFATRSGEVTGTPQYMPPEQAAGDIEALGAHSDIYSLGAVLYELLTLHPPFDGKNAREVREAVMHEQIVPPSVKTPERDVPHTIEQLCLQCLSRDPRNRPKAAGEVADRIDRFLEGEQDRARKEAERERLLEAGTRAAEAYYTCYEQHKQLQTKTAKMRTRVAPWAPSPERSRLWAQEDAEIQARIEAAQSLSEAMVAYHAALELDRDHPAARRALAALYFSAFEAAERDDDRVQMALYEHLVRAFDDDAATFSTRLKGDGRLELVTLPAGLTATLYTHTSVERVLKPISPKNLGQTPVVIDPMPMGSYLLKLQGPGLSPTVVPIAITRQKRLRLRLRLFPDRMRAPDQIHVLGGPARLGGDPLAQLARPARTIEVDDFFLAQRPVSSAQYRIFLHHVAQVESPRAAAARAPRGTPTGESLWPMDEMGRFTIPEEDVHGVAWDPDWPVVSISCADAEAYCAWLDETDGPGHRLPTEVEWEKAARGADGRAFPWGDTWEPTFCHMGISRPGAPTRGPAGAFPTDVSPYGVEDMAGGVSEWTSSWLEGAEQRVIKGGHWASGPTECRAASRFTQPVDRVLPTLGFRVARSAPT